MHTVRNAPMLIRGSGVHTTRVSTQRVVTLQNQPPNPQRALYRWSSPEPPLLPPDPPPQNPPPSTPCLYGSWVWSPESPWPPWASVVKAIFLDLRPLPRVT